jgi:hypothetical protein
MKNTVEIKIYNQSHSLVNSMVKEMDAKDMPQLIKMITISASKRNQYVQTRLVK